MNTLNLNSFFAERYPTIKALHPGEGRRKWKLRVIDELWKLQSHQRVAYLENLNSESLHQTMLELETDQDPLDVFTNRDVPGSGILLRTDYTNDTAWKDFLEKLREGEAELVSCLAEELDEKQDEEDEEMVEYENASASSPRNSTGNQDADEEMDEDEDDSAPSIFTVIDSPNDSPLRSLFTSISNLTSLRLLNDVNLSRAPLPPQGMKRIKPSNRLIDQDGLQETYQGKKIWIYDTRSNVDQSVRVVGQQGDVYGTATADSWRARVSHICELQVNLVSGAMTIDFGGLDRYDYHERVRNLQEAGNIPN